MDMGKVVEDAKVAMGLTAGGKVFSTDVLRVELSGPSQPHLTMVDLPGLFLAGNKTQSESDAKLVESLVLSYMSKPRSIILAVVSAKNDFALQQVTKHARALDPKGLRTLGLITKPDTLDVGSESEQSYLELAQNKDVEFELGWHVLRNRGFATRDVDSAARDADEAAFFSRGIWACLDPSQLGIKALKGRLSDVLVDQIIKLLPSVLKDIENGISKCKNDLRELGDSHSTTSEQRRYLFKAAMDFSNLTKAATEGIYTDAFFWDSALDWQQTRLRAMVQNTLDKFRKTMDKNGQAKIIVEEGDMDTMRPREILRSEYMKEVVTLMIQGRGRELPGTFNPLIVTQLFSKQCKPWERFVKDLVDNVTQSTRSTIQFIVRRSMDRVTAANVFEVLIDPLMTKLNQGLLKKTRELLEPLSTGHAITYNHYLTETVQKMQSARNKRKLKKQLESYFGRGISTGGFPTNVQPQALLDAMVTYTEPKMDEYACSMAVDMSEAYYKVALKRFVDNIADLAIEQCLIKELPTLLTPEKICDLSDDQIQDIAGECNDSRGKRKRAVEKLAVLECGMTELKRLRMGKTSSLD